VLEIIPDFNAYIQLVPMPDNEFKLTLVLPVKLNLDTNPPRKVHRHVYHSPLGLRVTWKKEDESAPWVVARCVACGATWDSVQRAGYTSS
jgi:hypothetical protein